MHDDDKPAVTLMSLASAPVPPPEPRRKGPQSLWELFTVFTWMALQGFGGVLAVVQRILVDDKQWMSIEEFVEQWSVAQVLPGPNVLNLCIILGGEYFGWRGAVVATLGILTAPCALVLMVAAWFSSVSDHAAVQGALRGLAAVVAGLIMATALRMSPAIRISPLGRGFALALVVLTFVLVGLLHVRLIWVLLALGSVSCVWAAREIRRRQ